MPGERTKSRKEAEGQAAQEKELEKTNPFLAPARPFSCPKQTVAAADRTGVAISQSKTVRLDRRIDELISALINGLDEKDVERDAQAPAREAYACLLNELGKKDMHAGMAEGTAYLTSFRNIITAISSFTGYGQCKAASIVKSFLEPLPFEDLPPLELRSLQGLEAALKSATRLDKRRQEDFLLAFLYRSYESKSEVREYMEIVNKFASFDDEQFRMLVRAMGHLMGDERRACADFLLGSQFGGMMDRFMRISDRGGPSSKSNAFSSFCSSVDRMTWAALYVGYTGEGAWNDIRAACRLSTQFADNELCGFFACCGCQAVKEAGNDDGKKLAIRKMTGTLGGLGIETYQRYNPEILENIYRTATDKDFSKGKRIAFVALAKDDWNGAFEEDIKHYEKLISLGYNLALCEDGTDIGVIRRFFNNGMTPGFNSAVGGRTYDLAIFGAHGDIWGMNYGGLSFSMLLGNSSENLELSDYGRKSFRKGVLAPKLSEKSTIILWSCSTGSESIWRLIPGYVLFGFRANPGSFKNVSSMLEALANKEGDGKVAKVFAPDRPSYISDFVTEPDGFVCGAKYASGAKTTEYGPKTY